MPKNSCLFLLPVSFSSSSVYGLPNKFAHFIPLSPYPKFTPTISNLFIKFSFCIPTFPLFIPHSTSLPESVLFCCCDPLMPANWARNISKGFGQGWFGSLKYCKRICIIQIRSWQSRSLKPSQKTGIQVLHAQCGLFPHTQNCNTKYYTSQCYHIYYDSSL